MGYGSLTPTEIQNIIEKDQIQTAAILQISFESIFIIFLSFRHVLFFRLQ